MTPQDSLDGGGWKVKDLIWEEVTSPREDGPPEPTGDWEADSIVGGYHVYIFDDHYEATRVDGDYVDGGRHCGDEDEAKAAAQLDFSIRISSALVPDGRGVVAWRWRAKVKGEWGLWSVVDVDPNDWDWRPLWEDMEIVPLSAAPSSPAQQQVKTMSMSPDGDEDVMFLTARRAHANAPKFDMEPYRAAALRAVRGEEATLPAEPSGDQVEAARLRKEAARLMTAADGAATTDEAIELRMDAARSLTEAQGIESHAAPVAGSAKVEPVLSAYEAQVLIGTSISGCHMPPDDTFDLKAAWSRLHGLGLIDRTDGLAIATSAGGERISAMLAASPPSPGTHVREQALIDAAAKLRQIKADLDDFDGDRRGHLVALEDAEQELIRVALIPRDPAPATREG